jgi:hypothetical protein
MFYRLDSWQRRHVLAKHLALTRAHHRNEFNSNVSMPMQEAQDYANGCIGRGLPPSENALNTPHMAHFSEQTHSRTSSPGSSTLSNIAAFHIQFLLCPHSAFATARFLLLIPQKKGHNDHTRCGGVPDNILICVQEMTNQISSKGPSPAAWLHCSPSNRNMPLPNIISITIAHKICAQHPRFKIKSFWVVSLRMLLPHSPQNLGGSLV